MSLKSTLVLFDTCVILEAFRVGAWDALVSKYRVVVSQTIVDETLYFLDDSGFRQNINLIPYINSAKIQVFDVPILELKKFHENFDPVYFEQLDPGELSLLCLLFKKSGDLTLISSGDAIVYKIIGRKRCSEKAISLEELLQKIGCNKNIKHCFRKKFKDDNIHLGFVDSLADENRAV